MSSPYIDSRVKSPPLFIFHFPFNTNKLAKYEKFFPTYIFQSQLPPQNKKLLKELGREAHIFRDLDEHGNEWSKENYYHGYTSYSSPMDLVYQSSSFSELKKWIDREVKSYAKALDFDFGQGSLVMSSSWINIMGMNAQHSFHLHPHSAISGVFFIQCPKGSAPFRVEDPRLAQFMGSAPRKPTARQDHQRFIDLVPKSGEMLLFESWLKHEVRPHRIDEERVSFSFNYAWVWS
jgi:uncharacterized protein (TIGR02466 family)